MYRSIEKDGLSLAEITRVTGGKLLNASYNIQVYNISTDTRLDVSHSLFVALKGEKYDGNNYILSAFDNGASACLVSRAPKTDKPYILVPDTLSAYGKIAAAYRRKFNLPVVAVTGSVGKTTTKEAICAVLGANASVCKTEKNFNNEVGLPKTLLSLTSNHGAAVVEMGMAARGEISNLSRIARPSIAVITNIGTSHIGNLGSRENIFRAKCEITDGLSDGGTLILNGDDDMLAKYKNPRGRTVFVGIDNDGCDFVAKNPSESDGGVSFDVRFGNNILRGLTFPAPGRHGIYAALFAVACGKLLGVDDERIRRGLLDYHPVGMRQTLVECGGYYKLIDCYNASLESVKAATDVLLSVSKRKRCRAVAVLGKMHELGEFSRELHEKAGAYAARADVLMIFGDGNDVEALARGCRSCGRVPLMLGADIDDAAKTIKENIKCGDVLLFKASRAEKLERLAEKI